MLPPIGGIGDKVDLTEELAAKEKILVELAEIKASIANLNQEIKSVREENAGCDYPTILAKSSPFSVSNSIDSFRYYDVIGHLILLVSSRIFHISISTQS